MAKSKVAESKECMGWTKDSPKCSNCKHYRSDYVREKSYGGREVSKEKNKRCENGNFATGLSCWCNEHQFKNK